jgi:hypothetical protein
MKILSDYATECFDEQDGISVEKWLKLNNVQTVNPWTLKCSWCGKKIINHSLGELRACLHNFNLAYNIVKKKLTKIDDVINERSKEE